MGEIVLGIGTSHSPMLAQPPELWAVHGQNDKRNQELVYPPDGLVYPYEEALERAHPDIAKLVDEDLFRKQHANLTNAIEELASSLRAANPDAVIIISDDQDEIFFEDNMPMFNIFWGESMPLIARTPPDDAPPAVKAMAWGYGDVSMDVPVDTGLARHIIEHMIDNDFDVSHSKYLKEESGGFVARRYPTPNGESTFGRMTQPTPAGHAPRLRLLHQAAHAQRALPHRPRLPEHLLPAEPADAQALLQLRRWRSGTRWRASARTPAWPSSAPAASATSSWTRSWTAPPSRRWSTTTRRPSPTSRGTA